MNSQNCTFCNPCNFNDKLVCSTNDAWILASSGQISEGYLLYVPKKHLPCFGAMDCGEIDIAMQDIAKIRAALKQEYSSFIMFEHGIVGQTIPHAHMHFIPGILDMRGSIWKDFPNGSSSIVHKLDQLTDKYQEEKVPYLLWQDADSDEINICWNPPAPPQYLRLKCAEAIKRPERGNWRTMDAGLDERLRLATLGRMRPHFLQSN